jgi:competence protein ComEC
MMLRVPFWKKAPFLRFLIPLVIGIIFQWELKIPVVAGFVGLLISLTILFLAFLLPIFSRFKLNVINGIAIAMLILSLGCLLTWKKEIANDNNWFKYYYHDKDAVCVTLDEPLVEKTNSFKAIASVNFVSSRHQKIFTTGKIIIYFKKDSAIQKLKPGEQILFSNSLQEIKNAGNPGGFDYKRYCLFEKITDQVYLRPGDFMTLKEGKENFLKDLLFRLRKNVLTILRKNIHGEKEIGLAEALLIGYKDDLDKNLVQSYTNTGVVHVIAISGLHLGLIYWLLVQLLRPLRQTKNLRWLSAVITIICLWLFSLLAGAQASVVRSAVMFTCIVIGESFSRKTSIYNTLAASAFILLCYNPFWLWDVGFQLSYAAVLGIVIFMRPVYNWFYVKNKLLDTIWKLNAVSIAAQLLTTPFSLYHFHQFPNLFLLTNFIAVPLSSAIVLGEIFLCSVSFLPFIATLSGKLLSWMIWLMNSYIERIEALPYSLWEGMQINVYQTVLLFLFVAGIAFWLLEKQRAGIWIGLTCLLTFAIIRSVSFYRCDRQKMIIVYNLPKHTAIDFIVGRKNIFLGDSSLIANEFAINFYIKPCRIMHRVKVSGQIILTGNNYFHVGNKHILIADVNFTSGYLNKNIQIDLLIISKGLNADLVEVITCYKPKQILIESSVPAWKIKSWMKDSTIRQVRINNVGDSGAFVMNMH